MPAVMNDGVAILPSVMLPKVMLLSSLSVNGSVVIAETVVSIVIMVVHAVKKKSVDVLIVRGRFAPRPLRDKQRR